MTAVAQAVDSGSMFARRLVLVTIIPFAVGPLVGWAGTEPQLWAWTAVALGAPHVGPTLAFYFDRELAGLRASEHDRFYRWPLIAVLVSLLVGFTAPGSLLPYGVTAFLAWQLHHFTRQNLGCFALLCKARGSAGPAPEERRMLDLTTVAAVCATPTASIAAPLLGEALLFKIGAAVLVLAGVMALRAARSANDPGRTATLLLLVGFYAPMFVFHSQAALLGYALAHGAQYLLMVAHLPGGRSDSGRMTAAVVAGYVLIGFPLYWAMTRTADPLIFGVFYGVTATHFLIDAAVWKARNPDQRAYMQRRFAFLSRPAG